MLCGLVFVNLDPGAVPLADLLGDLPQRLERYEIPSLVRAGGGRDHSQGANWKMVADNYLEGYHVPIAHPGLMRLLDYERYVPEIAENHVWFEAPMRDEPSENRTERLYQRLVRPMGKLTEADRHVWRYVFIYPNTALDLYPDQIGFWQINPRRPRPRPAIISRCCARAGRAGASASSAASTTASTTSSTTRTSSWSRPSRTA